MYKFGDKVAKRLAVYDEKWPRLSLKPRLLYHVLAWIEAKVYIVQTESKCYEASLIVTNRLVLPTHIDLDADRVRPLKHVIAHAHYTKCTFRKSTKFEKGTSDKNRKPASITTLFISHT